MSAICRIIAGVSGSPRSLPALRYGAALARGHGAVLIPLLTWAPPGGELADASCPCRYLRREWEGAARQRLDDAIHAAFGGMPDDVRTEMLVVRGEPGWVLVHAARRPGDVLVVGTGRRGRLGRLAGGRVSRYCLARASCPVLAVPPSALDLEAGHGLQGWAFRHRGLTQRDLAALAGNSAGAR
jgi:nucleotide-binding universal stress UspA family protein